MNNTPSAKMLSPIRLVDALHLALEGYQPVAGGTDLLVRRHSIMKSDSHSAGPKNSRNFRPIFYTGRIEGFGEIASEIKNDNTTIRIGSAATLTEIITHPLTPPPLSEALQEIASPGIRNAATLTGNICNASPAGDSLPVLYLLNTVVETAVLNNPDDNKISYQNIPLADFITGPGQTTLEQGVLVTGVRFCYPFNCKYFFRKVGTRAANALSKLSIAALYQFESEKLTNFRLAVGACGPKVIRCVDAENIMNGKSAAEISAALDEILTIYSSELTPIDDQRSTAEYRKNTALRLIRKIITEVYE